MKDPKKGRGQIPEGGHLQVGITTIEEGGLVAEANGALDLLAREIDQTVAANLKRGSARPITGHVDIRITFTKKPDEGDVLVIKSKVKRSAISTERATFARLVQGRAFSQPEGTTNDDPRQMRFVADPRGVLTGQRMNSVTSEITDPDEESADSIPINQNA